MIKIGDSIFSLLNASSEVTDVVGVNGIYPVVCTEEDASDFILYHLESVSPIDDNDVLNKSGDYIYRITLALEDYDDIQSLRNAIISVLNGFSGVNEGNDIREVRFINEKDGFGSDIRRYLRMIDFEFSINE